MCLFSASAFHFLPFLCFFVGIPFFFSPYEEFLVFFDRFSLLFPGIFSLLTRNSLFLLIVCPFFFQGFWGFGRDKNPCFFFGVVFPAFFDHNHQDFPQSAAIQMRSVSQYKWEAYCDTSGRSTDSISLSLEHRATKSTAIQMGGVLRYFLGGVLRYLFEK